MFLVEVFTALRFLTLRSCGCAGFKSVMRV